MRAAGPRLRCTRVPRDRKSTRLNSSHSQISYAVFCLKKKKKKFNNNCLRGMCVIVYKQNCRHSDVAAYNSHYYVLLVDRRCPRDTAQLERTLAERDQ